MNTKNLTNEKKLEYARTWFKMAKLYAETTDFETALFWALNSCKLYNECENNKSLLKEKGECEIELIKLNERCGNYESALTFTNYAYTTYKEIVKFDSSQSSIIEELELHKKRLLNRLGKDENTLKK